VGLNPQQRRAMLDDLYVRYGLGGGRLSGALARLRYWRKVWLWSLVVGASLALKRLLDVAGALAGLAMLSPVLLATALAVKIEDRGPVFYRQVRVGKDGATFGMYKFRSMRVDADRLLDGLKDRNESGGVIFKMRQDPRVTRVGRIIRKLSIDELPQFYNVLRGDMSLVGPRPPVPREVAEYGPADRRRLGVRPGITCLWQIGGRSELDFRQQVALDVQYIESRSFGMDLLILLKTVPAVLSGRGAY